jgi:glycosyltransferase involved in cell wall biosynthesis
MSGSSSDHLTGDSRRLVVLSEFVDATQNSTGYYWAKIVEGLAREFDKICVICPRSSYERIAERSPKVIYAPFRDRSYNKNNLFSRFFGQFIQTLHFCATLISQVKSGDVVFSGTNPSLSIFFIAKIKLFINFRWVLLVHDVFPENLAAARVVRKGGFLYSILKSLFDNAYSSADTLIAIGRDMQELLIEKSRNRSKVVYIPNWVDPADIDVGSRDSSKLLEGRQWMNKVVFQFFGNLGRVQGLDNLLAALRQVRNARAAFIFIGSGSEQDMISRFIEENPRLDIVHAAQLSFADNNIGLSACDIAMVSLDAGMKGLAVPSKAYFSLAADKPLLVISDEDSELHRLLSEERSLGWFCKCGSPSALANLIDVICELDLSELRGKPRLVLINKFGYSNAIKHYAQCINELRFPPN